ncbi:hypothetical protein M011DRAFT_77855 [Sporormia fimetaria CBS 119925]|uniref:Uncharacterized protein n=1 Tax=Sporormia fimetaria CBS 119925 TaxID=1340428 RepID=A0A6A6V876_9PLEO|nr:hypothetical protein M011DRAFT_77855 [Sporormia fimetaria CBS 119925]
MTTLLHSRRSRKSLKRDSSGQYKSKHTYLVESNLRCVERQHVILVTLCFSYTFRRNDNNVLMSGSRVMYTISNIPFAVLVSSRSVNGRIRAAMSWR